LKDEKGEKIKIEDFATEKEFLKKGIKVTIPERV